MKKTTLLLFFVAFAVMAFSQKSNKKSLEFKKSINPNKTNTSSIAINNHFLKPLEANRTKGVVLLSEDFEDGATTFPPTDWTTQSHAESTGAEEWNAYHHYFDNNPETEANARNIATIRYVTATNHLDEWLITPSISIPATGIYDLEFDWLSSYYWHFDPNNNGDITIEISTDGGTSWDTPIWQEDVQADVEASGTEWPWETYEWNHARIDISAYLGQDIMIAFHFVGLDAAFFDLDDVVVKERLVNDINILSPVAHFFYTNGGAYSKIPQEQNMGGLYGAVVKNIGTDEQTNITLNVDVNNGTESVYNVTSTETLASLVGSSHDTIMMNNDSGFVAPAVGNYQAVVTVLQEQGDEDLLNNSDTAYVEITEHVFARHYNTDYSFGLANWDGSVNGDFFGSDFHFINPDTVYGVRVFISEYSSGSGTLIAKIYDGDRNEIASSDDYDIAESDFGNYVVIPFLDLTGDDLVIEGDIDYTVGVEIHSLPDTLYLGGDDTTPYQYLDISTSIRINGEWFFTDVQPGIELLMHGWQMSINDKPLASSISVYPNPSTGIVNISNARDTKIEIYNMLGSAEIAPEIFILTSKSGPLL